MGHSSNPADASRIASEQDPRARVEAALPWLAAVAEKLEGMRYGGIHIVVRDSRVVQIEFTESHRFDPPCPV